MLQRLRRADRSPPCAGFNLIELMVAMTIVAILARLAYPAYTGYLVRSNRAAAQAQMMDIANREQQLLLASRSYADANAIAGSGYALPVSLSNFYSYSITVGTSVPPSFTVTFLPAGSQAPDGALTLTSEGVRGPAGKWQ